MESGASSCKSAAMSTMRTWSVSARGAWTLVLAALLALRLLGATGYMPALQGGAVTVIVCPDADANAPLALGDAHHHHGKAKHDHGACPYAAASALGALGADFGPLLAAVILSAVPLLGRPFAKPQLSRRYERPPLRGPPIPA
jgi:hypothetical protein